MKKGIIIEKPIMPKAIIAAENVDNPEQLLTEKPYCVSFSRTRCAHFAGRGSRVLLDFGKEISGGIRVIIAAASKNARLHIRFGESVSEACAGLARKNAGNDHSPRDIRVSVSKMSDLTFGQTAFRFALIEPVGDTELFIQNILGVCRIPQFPYEGYIQTDDAELNKILDTAAYTIKMNCQNGYIWDGVKRDRLVWSGDLHQEIITSAYLFGDIENAPNSLEFLRGDTAPGEWINGIPTYSAWWVINLCSYSELTGNREFFERNSDYAREIFSLINGSITENGEMNYVTDGMKYYLDWPTYSTPDAETGTAALMIYAARRYLKFESNSDCEDICRKLAAYLDKPCETKQVRAFQVLAGGKTDGAAEMIEKNGAHGFSTFMSYYILSADAVSDGKDMLSLIKSYFGAMLSRGATTFWEDFDLDWLSGSGRIDELPAPGEKDIHGDYGKYCYKGFRHSLCHGWSAGVYSFAVEYILGVKIQNGRVETVEPHPLGLKEIEAEIPTADGMLHISVADGKAQYTVKAY